MVSPTLRQCYLAANDDYYTKQVNADGTTTWTPRQNTIPRTSNPLHPFGLYGSASPDYGNQQWVNDNTVFLEDTDLPRSVLGVPTGVAPSGGLFLMVKPSYRIKLRITCDAISTFNGAQTFVDNFPVTEIGGYWSGVGKTLGEAWIEIVLAKGDFLWLDVDNEHSPPDSMTSQTSTKGSVVIGINQVIQANSYETVERQWENPETGEIETIDVPRYYAGDFVGDDSLEVFDWTGKLDDGTYVELLRVENVPNEENMFLWGISQGESAELNTDTGGLEASAADDDDDFPPLWDEIQPVTRLIGVQVNYKVEVYGEPHLSATGESWWMDWWVVVNGEKEGDSEGNPYDHERPATEAAQRRWDERPPPKSDLTPSDDFNWGAWLVVGLFTAGLGLAIWYVIKRGGASGD